MNDEEIKKILDNHEERIKKLEGKKDKQIPLQKREGSLREFIDSYDYNDDLDKTLLIIYYLEEIKGQEKVISKDVTSGFKEMRESVPGNISDKFQQLAKKGYIMPTGKVEKVNAWKYTNSGKEHIESLKK